MLHVSLRVMETHLDSWKPISQLISDAWKYYYLMLFYYYHEVIPAKASNNSWGHKSWNPNLNHELNDLNVQESHEIYSMCLWNGCVDSPDHVELRPRLPVMWQLSIWTDICARLLRILGRWWGWEIDIHLYSFGFYKTQATKKSPSQETKKLWTYRCSDMSQVWVWGLC